VQRGEGGVQQLQASSWRRWSETRQWWRPGWAARKPKQPRQHIAGSHNSTHRGNYRHHCLPSTHLGLSSQPVEEEGHVRLEALGVGARLLLACNRKEVGKWHRAGCLGEQTASILMPPCVCQAAQLHMNSCTYVASNSVLYLRSAAPSRPGGRRPSLQRPQTGQTCGGGAGQVGHRTCMGNAHDRNPHNGGESACCLNFSAPLRVALPSAPP